MNKEAIVIPTFSDLQGLRNLLEQLTDYEGQVIVIDSKPDHEKKHLVRLSVKHNVYLPLTDGVDPAVAVNKYLQNVQRKWILVMDNKTDPPSVDSLDKMSLYDSGLFQKEI